MRMKGRPRLTAALLAVATALVGFGFFQGFELNVANWHFPQGTADSVTQVATNNSSTYDPPSPTSIYANGIGPASGSFLGAVTSNISSQNCGIDMSGAIGNSLLCYGPATDFGLTPTYHNASSFPTNGYTTQLAIYLDTTMHQSISTVLQLPVTRSQMTPARRSTLPA